jgi:hypothetical protein
VLDLYNDGISRGFYFKDKCMDDFLDGVWGSIEAFLNNAVSFFDTMLSPLEALGPGGIIFVLSLFVVIFTRLIARFYETKRYKTLENEFHHWKGVREEALKHPDKEKGKTLAKNIDQAQLNKAYYDYFFEGFLKNMITNVIPILLMVIYITQVYTAQTLLDRFGEKWVFSLFVGTPNEINFSSLFWFVLCLIFSFILVTLIRIGFHRYAKKDAV